MKKDKFSSPMSGGVFIKGALLGAAVSIIAMLIAAAAMLFLELDISMAPPLATVSIALGTFVAAFYSAKKVSEKGYLIGLLTGAVTFAAVTLVSLICDPSGLSLNTLFHFVIIILSSFISGVLGVNKDKNKKYI